jgi:hypothetical protein
MVVSIVVVAMVCYRMTIQRHHKERGRGVKNWDVVRHNSLFRV